MSLPFDLEDVVGVAVADLIKRTAILICALYWGWLQAILAHLMTNVCYDFFSGTVSIGAFDNFYTIEEIGSNLILGWLFPVITSWVIFYLVTLLGFLFYLFKSECSLRWAFIIGAGIVGFYTLLAEKVHANWWGMITFAIWLMVMGSVIFLSAIWGNHLRRKAEIHLMVVEAENEQIRVEREAEERERYQ